MGEEEEDGCSESPILNNDRPPPVQLLHNAKFTIFFVVHSEEVSSDIHILERAALHPCSCCELLRRTSAALTREPHFQDDPPSIRVTVEHF